MKNLQDGLESQYDSRKQSQASTSKYIQTKIVDDKGNYKPSSIDGTPDDIIIKPNLKTSNCNTTKFLLQADGTVKAVKEDKVIKEVAPSKEKSEYGKIVVNESKGGFVSLRDETPNNKRSMNFHPSGTYNQIVNDGTMYEKIVKDRYLFVNNDWNISIGKDLVEVVYGDNKIQITKNKIEHVNGDVSSLVDGNVIENVSGNVNLEIAGNETEETDGDKTSIVNGNVSHTYTKNFSEQVNGNVQNTIMKNKTEVVCGGLNICAQGDITLSSGKTLNLIGNVLINGRIPMVR